MERNEAPWARVRALQFTEADAPPSPRPAPLAWRMHAAWLVLMGRAEITLWTGADRASWREGVGAPPEAWSRGGEEVGREAAGPGRARPDVAPLEGSRAEGTRLQGTPA